MLFIDAENSCDSLSVIYTYSIGISKYYAVLKDLEMALSTTALYLVLLTVFVTGSLTICFLLCLLDSYLLPNQPSTLRFVRFFWNWDPRLYYPE